MPETVAALNVLIFLLPGFVSQKMTEWLTARGQSSDTAMVRDALIFSLVNYLFYSFIAFVTRSVTFYGSPFYPLPSVPLMIPEAGALAMHGQQVEAIAMLVLISVVSGTLVSKANETGWLFSQVRGLGLTRKNSQLDVWYDVFTEFRGKWLRVCF